MDLSRTIAIANYNTKVKSGSYWTLEMYSKLPVTHVSLTIGSIPCTLVREWGHRAEYFCLLQNPDTQEELHLVPSFHTRCAN